MSDCSHTCVLPGQALFKGLLAHLLVYYRRVQASCIMLRPDKSSVTTCFTRPNTPEPNTHTATTPSRRSRRLKHARLCSLLSALHRVPTRRVPPRRCTISTLVVAAATAGARLDRALALRTEDGAAIHVSDALDRGEGSAALCHGSAASFVGVLELQQHWRNALFGLLLRSCPSASFLGGRRAHSVPC